MIAALALSILIGLALGMLGGGGSILTVPILVYALGVEPKRAIATSLLVVGVTSLAALVPHARAGRVDWRTGLVFGGAGMAGAYGGGRLAALIPGTVLMLLFAVVMLIAAAAMLRRAGAGGALAEGEPRRGLPLARVILDGLVVGAVTGLVGAGGGFLVVPALVLLGGMAMKRAVATSLVVIAMKSFAGLAGHLGHVTIEWRLAGLVAAAAVIGSVAGSLLAHRVPERALRKAFGGLTAAMAVVMLARELPQAVRASAAFQAIFVDRWPWYVGGAALSAFVLVMLWLENKPLGVSTGVSEVCALPRDPSARRSWRVPFLAGIVLGGAVAGLLAGRHPAWALGGFDALLTASLAVKLPILVGAGALIGYGARLAGGCTSGHSIVGVAQGARSSWVATGMFMIAGFATTQALVWLRH